ncbi:MAG: GxxExxY protein, partial [Chloroflexi bacterium]|nr:GxxExxY protein [Chloroflexota bacterium]
MRYSAPPSLRQAQDKPRIRLRSRSFGRLRTGLAHELQLRGIKFEQYVKLPVSYKGELIGDYEADFLIEGKIIL